MAKKITIELIEQLISEEIDNLPVETMDELTNPLAGVASGIKAMGGGLKAQFQKGRAGALGQKIAKKYQGQMAKVQQQLNKVNQNFEKEYAGYAKNPFLKQMLDDAKVMQQLQTAQGGITGASKGFANIVQQSAEAAKEAPTGAQAGPTPAAAATPGAAAATPGAAAPETANFSDPTDPGLQAKAARAKKRQAAGAKLTPSEKKALETVGGGTAAPNISTRGGGAPATPGTGVSSPLARGKGNYLPPKPAAAAAETPAAAAETPAAAAETPAAAAVRPNDIDAAAAETPAAATQADRTAAQATPAPTAAPAPRAPSNAAALRNKINQRGAVTAKNRKSAAQAYGGGEKGAARLKRQLAKRGIASETLMKKIKAIMQEGKKFKVGKSIDEQELLKKIKEIMKENKKIRIIKKDGRKK